MKDPYFIFCKFHSSKDPVINPWHAQAEALKQSIKENNYNSNSQSNQINHFEDSDPRRIIKKQVESLISEQDLFYREQEYSRFKFLQTIKYNEQESLKIKQSIINVDREYQAMIQEKESLENKHEYLIKVSKDLKSKEFDQKTNELFKIRVIFESMFGPFDEYLKRPECTVCSQSFIEENNKLLRCRSCKLYSHSLCLDPPIKANLSRGYEWQCEDCDDSTESDDE